MDLSIIVPTFNESTNIPILVDRIVDVLKNQHVEFEIWFIDDSLDHTPDLLNDLSKKYSFIHYLHRSGTRGLGSAVVEGFSRSTGKYCIVMDADLQHPPEIIPQIVERLVQGTDIVVPSRFIKNASDGGLNIYRKWISYVARKIGQIIIKPLRSISDCTSGYFGLRRNVINDVTLNPSSWKILIEILVKGHYQSVQEIPYAFIARDSGTSKMNLREQWNYLQHIVNLFLEKK